MKTIVYSILLLCSTTIFAMPNNIQKNQYPAPQTMTEEQLKQRLEAQLSFTKQQMAMDKKQAEAYAKNFAHYQKQQAAALQHMMQQAEKQREYALKRLEIQHQLILDSFKQFQIAQDKVK